jgi:hypothetical protein
MQLRPLQHVSVWVQDCAPDDKVFGQALEWAYRLNLPLRAIVAAAQIRPGSSSQDRGGNIVDERDRHCGTLVGQMKRWGDACLQSGVVLESFMWPEQDDAAIDQFFRPCGLSVFADASSEVGKALWHQPSIGRENALLLCSPDCVSITRVLVLYDQSSHGPAYLESVAHLCRCLNTCPIFLIVAKTEREARLRQEHVEGFCSRFRLLADHDFVVRCDVGAAVSKVSSWRSCSHVIVERRFDPATRPGGYGLSLVDSITLLALPGTVVLDVPTTIRSDRLRCLDGDGISRSVYDSKQELCAEVFCE